MNTPPCMLLSVAKRDRRRGFTIPRFTLPTRPTRDRIHRYPHLRSSLHATEARRRHRRCWVHSRAVRAVGYQFSFAVRHERNEARFGTAQGRFSRIIFEG